MIKIHRSIDKQFYYTVHAKNGKVLVTSETMKRIQSIQKSIAALYRSIELTSVYDLTAAIKAIKPSPSSVKK